MNESINNKSNNKNNKIKAVLFDMDGTLFDTETESIYSWAAAARKFGLDITREFMMGCIGLPTREIAARFYERFGDDLDYDAFREYKLKIMADIINTDGPAFKPGIDELMEYIKSEGLLCAVATSTMAARARFNLDAGGILEKLDCVISGDMVKNGKPYPDIYVLAAGRLGLTPFDCLVIEDSRNGILSAAGSGAVSVLIPDIIPPDEDMLAAADYRCDSLDEVIGIIENLNK